MLITGIVRLGLFEHVFTFDPQDQEQDKVRFDSALLKELELNQLLSIWLAFYSEQKLTNAALNYTLMDVINAEQGHVEE
jgi:hypothetical protein